MSTGGSATSPTSPSRPILEGDDEAVEAMVAWCGHGPSSAKVRHVAVTEARPTGATAFEIRY